MDLQANRLLLHVLPCPIEYLTLLPWFDKEGRNLSEVWQIRVDGSSRALQYETVQAVENGPILRDMAFSSDHHYLYVMSETQWWQTLLKQPELVDSRPPAVSGAWDPYTQSVIDGMREKYRERKHDRKTEVNGAHNRRLRTELVDTAPLLLF
eukprot:superscaffoldBa00004214_g18470